MTASTDIGVSTCLPDGSDLVRKCVDLLTSEDVDVVLTAAQDNGHHPWRGKRLRGDGLLEPLVELPDGASTNRQGLEAAYFLDGRVVVWRKDKMATPIVGEGVKVICVRA